MFFNKDPPTRPYFVGSLHVVALPDMGWNSPRPHLGVTGTGTCGPTVIRPQDWNRLNTDRKVLDAID